MAARPALWLKPKIAIGSAIPAGLLLASLALARSVDAPRAIAIKASPIESFDIRAPGRGRLGALEFRGGLELTSVLLLVFKRWRASWRSGA
jgi:hypothetical protein